MDNRHNNTQKNPIDLLSFFENPTSARQRHYETVRAIIKDGVSAEDAAQKFGYSTATVYALLGDARCGRINLFPELKMGPKRRHTPEEVQELVIRLRKQENLATTDIHRKLTSEDVKLSTKTVERILKEAGFKKLSRRTHEERGISKKNKALPERSAHLNFETLEPFWADCPTAGVFFFIPYILESGILEIVKACGLPESSDIGAEQAALSMLLLKLVGNERLSQMDRYDCEPGLGVFAGLNVLPKATYMGTYSCRTSEEMLNKFQSSVISRFRQVYPDMYKGNFINLDFHSIVSFR